jgi:hypothetical protein
VILTKDNLVKRNWQGCTKYVFCHEEEKIKHILFNCRVARSIWSIIQIGSTLYPPRSIANIFGNWLNGVDSRYKTIIRVGAIAVAWPLWLCRNDKVLNDKKFLYHAGHLPVYSFAPFMVATSTFGGSRPLYGGVYTIAEHS